MKHIIVIGDGGVNEGLPRLSFPKLVTRPLENVPNNLMVSGKQFYPNFYRPNLQNVGQGQPYVRKITDYPQSRTPKRLLGYGAKL